MVDEERKEDGGAPPRRFAPNAAKAAAQEPSGDKQTSSYVFLRVKRKRHEDPVEHLLVQSEPEPKRQQRGDEGDATQQEPPQSQRGLLAAFAQLSTKERGFVFKRIETLESHQVDEAKWAERLKKKAKSLKATATQRVHAKKQTAEKASQALTQSRVQQQQARGKERRQSEVLRSRGLAPLEMKEQKTVEMSGLRVVDLTVSAAAADDAEEQVTTGVTVNGAKVNVKRVMNPYEREVDEAVWTAFQHNDFSHFFRIFHSYRPELRVDPAAFQRPADGGTILMAAAMHGRADVIEVILRSSAARVLQEDWNGATAASFAHQHGHKNVETALLACEEAEREKEYVYDVYCIDISASEQQSSVAGAASQDGDLSNAPVVHVSSAVQRWLTQEAGQRVDAEDDVDEFMLESDHDDQLDSDGESIDSNHENYAFNDYPEESSGSEYDSDDSDVNFRRRMAGTMRQPKGQDQRVLGADEFDY